MTNPDPREIEEQLARDRAALTQSIDALRNRLTKEHVVSDVFGMIKSNPAPYTLSLIHISLYRRVGETRGWPAASQQ